MISESMIEALRERIEKILSAPRFSHTLGVERCAERLAELCSPDKKTEIRAAALLHDVTKELSFDEHIKILSENGFPLSEEDKSSSGVLHSFSAPFVIARDFLEFCDSEILSSVFKHTLGDEEMSVFDEIIFLADFIEETREYDSSIKVRGFVFENMKNDQIEENVKILHRACLMEIESTVSHLSKAKRPIHTKTKKAMDALIAKL